MFVGLQHGMLQKACRKLKNKYKKARSMEQPQETAAQQLLIEARDEEIRLAEIRNGEQRAKREQEEFEARCTANKVKRKRRFKLAFCYKITKSDSKAA